MQPAKFYSTILAGEFEYSVYLPAGYETSSQRFPTIYLLHGRGDSMVSWQLIQTDLDQQIAEGRVPPMIAILPDVPSSKRASYYIDSGYALEPIRGDPVETAFIQELIPHIDATYRTIPARSARAIAGYSMGGYAAARYPLAHPDQFSATIILSPAVYVPLPPRDSSARNFGAFGNGEAIFDEAIYQEKNYPALLQPFEASRLPLYAFIAVGDDEWRNPVPEDYEHDIDFEAARLYNKLVHTGYVVAQFRVLNGGHDWDVWRPAFIEGASWIFRFLDPPHEDS
jgi:enterochelin esterase-like enzyme